MLTQTVPDYCNPDEVSIRDVDRWCLRNLMNGKKQTNKKPTKIKTQQTKTNKQIWGKVTTTKEIHKQSQNISTAYWYFTKMGNKFEDWVCISFVPVNVCN